MGIERFNIDEQPTAGRPRVLALRGDAGELAVHVLRENGSLWLYATGPRGGDRGMVVIPTRRAGALAEWLRDGCRNAAPSTTGALWIEDDGEGNLRAIVAERAGRRDRWTLKLDAEMHAELTTCLSSWAETMKHAPVS